MVSKRKAASTIVARVAERSGAKLKKEADESAEIDYEEDEEVEELSEEEIRAKQAQDEKKLEKETAANREKELKSMYVDELKKFVESKSLQIGKRDDMIKAILKLEAKERAQQREHEATIRSAVTKKKEEFEALSAPQLKRLCAEKDIKGNLSKGERVQTLLKLWVEDDGINKAQLQEAREQRSAELTAMDKQALRKICEKAGIDIFLKDVMVDRVVMHESEKGCFSKPVSNLEQDLADATPKLAPNLPKADLVGALLMKQMEENKKCEKEAEEAAKLAQKVKELNKKPADELKKLLKKKKVEVQNEKKDEMVKALINADIAEELAVSIRGKLTSMSPEALAKLVAARGLNTSKSKNAMVDAILAHEADVKKKCEAFEAEISKVAATEKQALQSKTAGELKEMCSEKGLAAGLSKEDRINRLVEAVLKSGDLDAVATKALRNERKRSLDSMDKAALVQVCEDLGIDTLVKEVMVERILSHEAEIGEPVPKKARKSSD